MSRFLRPILICLCVAIVASATVEARPGRKRPLYYPDIAVAEIRKLLRKGEAARLAEFLGLNFFEHTPEVPAQNIILPGGENVTERYIVEISSKGTIETDEIRIKFDVPDKVTSVARAANGVFEVTIVEAKRRGTKVFRGDDVTADFEGNGIVVEMASRERRYYWVEIAGLPGFGKNDYVAVPILARSITGSNAVAPMPAIEDYFFVTAGEAGEVLIPAAGVPETLRSSRRNSRALP